MSNTKINTDLFARKFSTPMVVLEIEDESKIDSDALESNLLPFVPVIFIFKPRLNRSRVSKAGKIKMYGRTITAYAGGVLRNEFEVFKASQAISQGLHEPSDFDM